MLTKEQSRNVLLSIQQMERDNFDSGLYDGRIDRFLLSFEKNGRDECWPWKRPLTDGGYGQILLFGRRMWAHRASYIIFKGYIEPKMLVCHSCDNRACCNPDHLFLGTPMDNTRDMILKGRDHKSCQKLENNNGSKLDKNKVVEIRRLGENGLTHKVIAQKFGVARTTISSVLRGENWKF